jgi:hypothetical protein
MQVTLTKLYCHAAISKENGDASPHFINVYDGHEEILQSFPVTITLFQILLHLYLQIRLLQLTSIKEILKLI